MKRKRNRTPTTDAMQLFEQTVVAMCRERGLHRTMTPVEIDRVVVRLVKEFVATMEEFSEYIEVEDWDGLDALAKQEQTRQMMHMLRGVV